jgi:hypothetical protein
MNPHPQDVSRLVNTYIPRGVFLDAELIVLFVVGAISRHLVPRHQKTSAYTGEDFELLLEFVARFSRRVTTANVLTEASNHLAARNEAGVLKELCIDAWEELSFTSQHAAARGEYAYLGLADAATIHAASESYLVLTADRPLVVALQALNRPVLHFDWLREWAEL